MIFIERLKKFMNKTTIKINNKEIEIYRHEHYHPNRYGEAFIYKETKQPWKYEIHLYKDHHPATMIHELLHVLLKMLGFDIINTEEFVEPLALAIHEALKEIGDIE